MKRCVESAQSWRDLLLDLTRSRLMLEHDLLREPLLGIMVLARLDPKGPHGNK